MASLSVGSIRYSYNKNFTRRRYNRHLANARHEVRNFTYLHYEELERCYNRIKIDAKEYEYEVNDSIIFLACKKHHEIIKIPYVQRFSPRYASSKYSRLKEIEKCIMDKFHNAIFLTLTVDPKRFFNPYEMYKHLLKAWNSIATILRKKYSLEYYIRTVEFTDSHIPHLHVLLFFDSINHASSMKLDYFIPVEWLRGLWVKYGMGTIINIKYIKTTFKISKDGKVSCITPVSYIMKYITKVYGQHDNKGCQHDTKVCQHGIKVCQHDCQHDKGYKTRV